MKARPEDLGAEEHLLKPLHRVSPKLLVLCGLLFLAVLNMLFAFAGQVWFGLGVTGMNQPVTWGFYIVNFVFFIGISHAGTLISAILRLSQAEWRRPITRMAEVITALVLAIGGIQPIIDLGRPDRVFNIFTSGRLQSPLLWDVTSISAYFMASTVFLYLPLIPDIALLRDRGGKLRWAYDLMSWGYRGTERQKHVLERAMTIMMIIVIPIAVSVHTVISYIFAMTIQPGWHSTIFGPYFVCGAIFSGIAALLIVMIAFRKAYHLEDYLKPIHFSYLGQLLLIMSLLWFYFTFSEYLTAFFGNEPQELRVVNYKFTGAYWPLFWGMIVANFVIPVALLSSPKIRTIPNILVASICVVIGMWLERLNIVVPSLANPRLPYATGFYIPSYTEWSLFLGMAALFVLMFIGFSKFFPLISVWEIQEGRTHGVKEVTERVESYLPPMALEGKGRDS
ncbi:MAG TPA: NrfD/PsrC family molybdoenzyme membrane anchor subunit [Bdellovibrionota bacterium]|nr:NrfD/PsrC family molybdoenzyme membrane anchor subunit [Bdellovibrionota bacterium]